MVREGSWAARAEAENCSDHQLASFFCCVVSRQQLSARCSCPCVQGSMAVAPGCTEWKNPHWIGHKIAVLSSSEDDPTKVLSPAPEFYRLRFAFRQEAEMCFSNANFRNSY